MELLEPPLTSVTTRAGLPCDCERRDACTAGLDVGFFCAGDGIERMGEPGPCASALLNGMHAKCCKFKTMSEGRANLTPEQN